MRSEPPTTTHPGGAGDRLGGVPSHRRPHRTAKVLLTALAVVAATTLVSGTSPASALDPAPPTTTSCPTLPVRVTAENAYGAAIARWVCRMWLVGGPWEGQPALVLLPPDWFYCPPPPSQYVPMPGNDFATWLYQHHCAYEPVPVRTVDGHVVIVLEAPLANWWWWWAHLG